MSCLSGVVLTTWSSTRSKLWRWSWTSGETPPCSPLIHHHEQHCDCTGVIQIPGHHHLPGPESGTITLSPWWKRPSRGCTSFASWGSSTCRTWAADTALLCIIESVLCTSITVWFSSATKSDLRRLPRVARTLSESLVHPPHSQETVLIQREQKGWQNHIQHTPSLNYYCLVDATELWAPERPDTGTVSFPRQSISWTLEQITINMKHTTLSYMYLFNTHTYYISICT